MARSHIKRLIETLLSIIITMHQLTFLGRSFWNMLLSRKLALIFVDFSSKYERSSAFSLRNKGKWKRKVCDYCKHFNNIFMTIRPLCFIKWNTGPANETYLLCLLLSSRFQTFSIWCSDTFLCKI